MVIQRFWGVIEVYHGIVQVMNDLRDAGAMLYQLSYEATHLGLEKVSLLGSCVPVEGLDERNVYFYHNRL